MRYPYCIRAGEIWRPEKGKKDKLKCIVSFFSRSHNSRPLRWQMVGSFAKTFAKTINQRNGCVLSWNSRMPLFWCFCVDCVCIKYVDFVCWNCQWYWKMCFFFMYCWVCFKNDFKYVWRSINSNYFITTKNHL